MARLNGAFELIIITALYMVNPGISNTSRWLDLSECEFKRIKIFGKMPRNDTRYICCDYHDVVYDCRFNRALKQSNTRINQPDRAKHKPYAPSDIIVQHVSVENAS